MLYSSPVKATRPRRKEIQGRENRDSGANAVQSRAAAESEMLTGRSELQVHCSGSPATRGQLMRGAVGAVKARKEEAREESHHPANAKLIPEQLTGTEMT